MHPFLAGAPPLGMAHRGAHDRDAGENSFEAFAAAVELGYGYLETDVHRTADGVLVAMHDATLDRTTDGEGAVAQRAWGEIARLTVTGGGRVPRLDELLATWPRIRWNLDCKDPDATADLVALLREHDALDRVNLGSFHTEVVTTIRAALGGQACTTATSWEVRLLVAAGHVPRFARWLLTSWVRADCVQVPVADGRVTIVTDRFVEACHDAGLPVHVWTIDEREAMVGLLDLGVDGLLTDRPRVLREVLAARGAWPPTDRGERDDVAADGGDVDEVAR